MAPIPTNAFGAGPHTISKRASDATAALGSLLRRSLEPRRPSEGNYTRPGKMNGGVLVVFCLIGASLGLLAWWLFIRRSGFIWRKYDWADYKASVLRRPQDRPDDAITVFSDGTARRGGSGSSVGRSVVLGELDTTYQKSYVAGEKPWNARDLPPAPKQPSLISAAYRDVKDSVWGKIRGGDRSENDTVVQRERSLRRERSKRRRRENRDRERGKKHQEEQSPIEMRKQNYRPYDSQQYRNDETETEISTSYVDNQRPAPPLTDMSHSSVQPPPLHRPRGSRSQPTRTQTRGPRVQRPERASTRAGKAPAREPSYRPGDDHANARYHRAHNRNNSQAVSESESDTDTDTDTESSDDDDSTIDQSQLGMAKGNKTYKHTISPEQTFWGNARPVERNGGGAGGTYGGGAPALMPSSSKAPRGYRAASVGSLSSDGSVRSSNAGR